MDYNCDCRSTICFCMSDLSFLDTNSNMVVRDAISYIIFCFCLGDVEIFFDDNEDDEDFSSISDIIIDTSN